MYRQKEWEGDAGIERERYQRKSRKKKRDLDRDKKDNNEKGF